MIAATCARRRAPRGSRSIRATKRLSSVGVSECAPGHRRRPGQLLAAAAACDERVAKLLQIEGIALGAFDDLVELGLGQLALLWQRRQECAAGSVRQRLERQLGGPMHVLAEPENTQPPAVRGRIDAGGGNDEYRRELDEFEELLGERTTRRVCPVEVFHSDDNGPLPGNARDPARVRAADLGSKLLGGELPDARHRPDRAGPRAAARGRGRRLGSSDAGSRLSFARSLVRTESSASPSSTPTQPRSISMKGPYRSLVP